MNKFLFHPFLVGRDPLVSIGLLMDARSKIITNQFKIQESGQPEFPFHSLLLELHPGLSHKPALVLGKGGE